MSETIKIEAQPVRAYGISTLKVWKKGVIQSYLDHGFTLEQAKFMAESSGDLVDVSIKHNLIVNGGYAHLALMVCDDDSGLSYFEIGTGSTAPALTDTDLTTGVSRKQFTTRDPSGPQATLSVFFPSEDCTYNIAEAGVFCGSAATATLGTGTLFSHFLQTYDNSLGEYDLTFEYVLTFQAA